MYVSKEFSLMLDKAIEQHFDDFKNFDRTKNIQEQLQEMLYPIDIGWQELAINFGIWLQKERLNFSSKVSMEQLWLAFVIQEKYSNLEEIGI